MAEKTPQEMYQEWMDSQNDYIGKENKAAWWKNYNQGVENDANLKNVFSSEPTKFNIGGSTQEQAGRIEGLQRAKILTGQDPHQIGKDYQEAYGNIKKRTQGTDTGSELLRANKGGAIADAKNTLQAQGVKGGSALGAISSVERAKSYDVNNQLMQAQQEAQKDYMNAAKNNANFTTSNEMNYGAMALGKDVKAPASNSNGFGTVICTELNRQGYFSTEIFILDQQYGYETLCKRPHVYFGYIVWAKHVAKLMKKSKLFTKLVAFFAVPWALNMAGERNLFGRIISVVGEIGCGIIGKLIMGGTYAIQKAK